MSGSVTAPPPAKRLPGAARARSLQAQLRQRRPARIGRTLVLVLCSGLVEVDAADRTEARAVLATEKVRGHAQGQRVADPGTQVEHPILDVRGAQLVVL